MRTVQKVTTIEATIRSGLGLGSGSVALQKTALAPLFPEISKCHNGTINLRLDILILNPDLTTPPIQWGPPGSAPEIFGIQRIEFEYPVGGRMFTAWVYIPHLSPHFNDLFSAEIIAATISGFKPSARCRIHIPKPHRLEPVVVI